ncbi:hypothetical protein JEQ12_010009 [Ovis aries]|uniref:Uncharacterized protein n=1 Tax=Ovis aries TaxID=9940 RepID=A0A836D6C7_SHEEP|nr:hypothetical protein JEQ12_010009 [Ovis aries]
MGAQGDQRGGGVTEASSLLGGSPRRPCGQKGSPYHTGQLHPVALVADLLQHINQVKTAEGYGFKQDKPQTVSSPPHLIPVIKRHCGMHLVCIWLRGQRGFKCDKEFCNMSRNKSGQLECQFSPRCDKKGKEKQDWVVITVTPGGRFKLKESLDHASEPEEGWCGRSPGNQKQLIAVQRSGLGLDQDWYPGQELSRKAGVVTCIVTELLLASLPINSTVPAPSGQREQSSSPAAKDACTEDETNHIVLYVSVSRLLKNHPGAKIYWVEPGLHIPRERLTLTCLLNPAIQSQLPRHFPAAPLKETAHLKSLLLDLQTLQITAPARALPPAALRRLCWAAADGKNVRKVWGERWSVSLMELSSMPPQPKKASVNLDKPTCSKALFFRYPQSLGWILHPF